ncbi:MAG: PaaI family thioesterase [Bacteroidales bacterium]|nr:PaaI family thioesterase [Bacteroidales bacterium]
MQLNIEKLQHLIGKNSQSYGSPVMKWLNPTLISVNEKGLTYKYLIRNEMTNPSGKLHGGISALIIDDAIGATMIAFNENFIFVTVNNNIDYKSAVDEGETIIAETSILESENRIITVQCDIWNEDKSKIVAKGTSKLLKRPR